MAITAGTRAGVYEIGTSLGAGGMGEVYRARDTRLNRDVAIKVLSSLIGDGADRSARFEREAQLLASLNHPHIAHLYGFEPGPPAFLIMELVEGPTLADVLDVHRRESETAGGGVRTPRGLALDDVVSIGRQIAMALEAAHEQGIVHRDLKPANVKLRDDGTVKVLDFGLAKALGPDGPGSTTDAMNSPTLTNRATQLGVVLGTAAYMSPEQAKGRPVDKRADIWAFGVVMYELVTGRRLFDGDSVAETIGLVVTRDPDWSVLPASTPTSLRRLLARCLTRDPKQRLRDIGEARIALEDAGGPADQPPAGAAAVSRNPRHLALVAGAVGVAILAAGGGWYMGSRNAVASTGTTPYRAEIVPTPADAFDRRSTVPLFTFTPDGSTLIYASSDPTARLLYRRDREAALAVPIAGTEGAYGPFVSHDGISVGFFADGAMKRVPIGGGAARAIHNLRSAGSPDTLGFGWTTELGPGREVAYGATWLADDSIVYGRFFGGLWQVSAAGGRPRAVTKVEAGEIGHRLPRALPGGRAVLCTVIRDLIASQDSSVEAVDLATGRRTMVLESATDGRYAGGVLWFARRGALYAIAFDPASLKVSGEPIQLSDDVMHAIGGGRPGQASGVAQYDVAPDGMLAFIRGGTNAGAARRAVWVSRGGKTAPFALERGSLIGPRLTRDDSRLAIRRAPDVVLVNAATGVATPLVKDALFPVWAHDESRVFVARRSDDGRQEIYGVSLATGDSEVAVGGPNPLWASSASRDGRYLAYVESNPATGNDIWVVGLAPKAGPTQIAATPASEGYPAFSPNGAWLAYAIEEGDGDVNGVYVRPFPMSGRAERIAGAGSTAPVWARDGKSLFYGRLTADGSGLQEIVQVQIDTNGPRLHVGAPTTFATGTFNRSVPVSSFDVTADGGRILATIDAPQAAGAAEAVRTLQLFFGTRTSGRGR